MVVRSNAARLSTTRLCSTATRLWSMSSAASSSLTVSGPASSCESPLSVMVNGTSSILAARPLLDLAQREVDGSDWQLGLQLHRQPPDIVRQPERHVASL